MSGFKGRLGFFGAGIAAALLWASSAVALDETRYDFWIWENEGETESLIAVTGDDGSATAVRRIDGQEEEVMGRRGAKSAVGTIQDLIDAENVDLVIIDRTSGGHQKLSANLSIDVDDESGDVDIEISGHDGDGDGGNISIRSSDGTEGDVVIIRGADEDGAREFIDDLDDISDKTRKAMRDALGL